jgi:hypothetical protein
MPIIRPGLLGIRMEREEEHLREKNTGASPETPMESGRKRYMLQRKPPF